MWFTSQPSMQANPVSKSQSSQTSYQASVPISLYRELAAELQRTQAKLSTAQFQNEQINKHNQLLIKEFEAITQSAQRIQMMMAQSTSSATKLSDVVANIRSTSQAQAIAQSKVQAQAVAQTVARSMAQPQTSPQAPSPAQPIAEMAMSNGNVSSKEPIVASMPMYEIDAFTPPEPMFTSNLKPKKQPKTSTHQEIATGYDRQDSASSGNMSGWWLALTIILIVGTSFGAGYFLMRPFINNSAHSR
jgi:cobalamin biosynthesis Mg chelatase CobN